MAQKADGNGANKAAEMAALFKMMMEQAEAQSGKIEKPYQSEVISDPNANKIIIPQGMTKLQAAKELKLQYENEEQVINVDKTFEGWNWQDVLVALKIQSEEQFGWINGVTEYTFFGVKRPTEIDIVVDIKDGKSITEKCFYGKFEVAAWENAETQVSVTEKGVTIRAVCKKKFTNIVSNFYKQIERHLLEKSIFRGKTVVVNGRDMFGNINFELIENKGEERIILNRSEELVLNTFILPALTERGKKAYLFTGEYGTGKTETAMRVGREGNKKGLTFFYCKDSSLFQDFLALSKRYQPAIVFLEDIDEIGAGTERTTDMNQILNTLDGVQTKGNNLIVIFTTNHEDRINPALRRPGRIDQIVNFAFPEKDTMKRIYEVLMEGVSGYDHIDFDTVVEGTPSVQGAVIAEICKRAHKLALRDGRVNTDSMLAAVASMEYQIEFMKERPRDADENTQFVNLLKKQVGNAVEAKLQETGVLG
jgi:transitional endoplasmic reticulum ATPase